DPSYNIPHVSIDNYQAARDAVEYLIAKGHTQIGTVSSNNRFFSAAERMRGFRDALTDAGLTVNEEYIRYAAWDDFKASSKAAYSLLKGPDHPTALFCISDILALGAIASAKELGLRVPEDISVIGFDDVEYTTMFHPYVTTVVQPCYEIGYHALDLVCRMIRRKEVPKTTVLAHHLVFRESVAVKPQDTV
ncbi:MAG: substrate-binding domain-containing protein, partial [Firmicutes bacterium]|nr:substrate-binding domain-containing protein [Bacillota bacterium]